MHDDELTFPFQDNSFRGLEMPVQLHTEPRALRRAYLESVEKLDSVQDLPLPASITC